MQFGQVTHESHLKGLTLKLPKPQYYPTPNKPAKELKLILGAPVWGCEGWRGSLYPSNAKSKEFLYHYSRSLEAIELNSTFYGLPSDERLKNWVEQTPSDFIFCPKVPRHISHSKDQLIKTERWINFWKRLDVLSERQVRVFLQLPETYSLSYLSDLENLLKTKPAHSKIAVEFRHPEYFNEGQVIPEVCELFSKWNAYPIISDTLGKRYSLHQSYIGGETFVRFLGREDVAEDTLRLKEWVLRFEELRLQGVKTIYFFVHQPDESFCAQTLADLSDSVSKLSTTQCKKIHFFNEDSPLLI